MSRAQWWKMLKSQTIISLPLSTDLISYRCYGCCPRTDAISSSDWITELPYAFTGTTSEIPVVMSSTYFQLYDVGEDTV